MLKKKNNRTHLAEKIYHRACPIFSRFDFSPWNLEITHFTPPSIFTRVHVARCACNTIPKLAFPPHSAPSRHARNSCTWQNFRKPPCRRLLSPFWSIYTHTRHSQSVYIYIGLGFHAARARGRELYFIPWIFKPVHLVTNQPTPGSIYARALGEFAIRACTTHTRTSTHTHIHSLAGYRTSYDIGLRVGVYTAVALVFYLACVRLRRGRPPPRAFGVIYMYI